MSQQAQDSFGFNSRPHEEVDHEGDETYCSFVVFQLTTSRRGRHCMGHPDRGTVYVSTHDLTKRSTRPAKRHRRMKPMFQLTTSRRGRLQSAIYNSTREAFQLTTSRRGRQQFLRKKFSFQNHFLCSLHIIYSYYINTIFFSTLFLAKSSFFLVRIL